MRLSPALLIVLCAATVALAAAPSGAMLVESTSTTPADADAAAAPPADETTTATATPTSAPAENVDYGLLVLYADDGETVREVAIAPADVASVGAVDRDPQTGRYVVPVTLTERGAENFTAAALAAGFGDGGTCRYEERPEDPGECLLTVADGDVIFSAGVQPELGRAIDSGDFVGDPQFVLNAENESQAERLRAALSGDVPVTATATPDEATSATRTTEYVECSECGPIPGFGSAAVVAAVLTLGVLVTRRRDR